MTLKRERTKYGCKNIIRKINEALLKAKRFYELTNEDQQKLGVHSKQTNNKVYVINNHIY